MDNENKKMNTKTKILFWITFIAIGILAINNFSLKMELAAYKERSDEFHNNLYAQVDGTLRDGAHTLSISDIYYRKHFKSEKE